MGTLPLHDERRWLYLRLNPRVQARRNGADRVEEGESGKSKHTRAGREDNEAFILNINHYAALIYDKLKRP